MTIRCLKVGLKVEFLNGVVKACDLHHVSNTDSLFICDVGANHIRSELKQATLTPDGILIVFGDTRINLAQYSNYAEKAFYKPILFIDHNTRCDAIRMHKLQQFDVWDDKPEVSTENPA